MTGCPSFGGDGPAGIGEALRIVDCQAAGATAHAFSRLFGAGGVLVPVLTTALTLYIAWTAVGMLTGRSRVGLSGLTPRMMLIGATLTFATSWLAYQSVVWNLLVGGPDQIAGVLLGSHGSATTLFADRLDRLFGAIADAAQSAQAGQAAGDKTIPAFTPATLLWLSTMLLLLGTAGVLLTARIALAALLALGPIFVLLAIFRGTRGLFEGWLRASVLFALVPLFAVLIGGGAVLMLTPVAESLGNDPTMQQAATMFLGTAVYAALMVIVLKVAATLVMGWRLGASTSSDPAAGERADVPSRVETQRIFMPATSEAQGVRQTNDRARAIAAAVLTREPSATNPAPDGRHRNERLILTPCVVTPLALPAPVQSPMIRRASALGRELRGPAQLSREQHA